MNNSSIQPLIDEMGPWNWPWILLGTHASMLGLAIFLLSKHKTVYKIIQTFPRDLVFMYGLLRVALDLFYCKFYDLSVVDLFDLTVKKYPKKVMMFYEEEKWTGEEIQSLSFKIGNYFQKQGFKFGDTIGLFMENRAEYFPIWIGLGRIGCQASLINCNLKHQPLKHCLEAVNCKAIIYNSELSSAVQEVKDIDGLKNVPLFYVGKPSLSERIPSSIDLLDVLQSTSDHKQVFKKKLGFNDPIFFIYTSGTTGLPKAAVIKSSRFFMASFGSFRLNGLYSNDIVYTSLPLYHSVGTMLGFGALLGYGASVVIRKKFSVSNFWKDCVKYKVTAAQYIGELCRYLISQPPSSFDRSHRIRVMFGNGLRADIWPKFMERFNIKKIAEYYGATEGNCNVVNTDGKVGAIGFYPIYLRFFVPYKLIKVDELGNPRRNEKGFAIECEGNEPGELIGKIGSNPITDFKGYADKSASKHKILENVIKKGDAWFRSGDILVMDDYGYLYFKDRAGDTFRWKGENCSTTEIESVISNVCGLKDVIVFGVTIPGTEGKAGMAVICDDSLDLEKLSQGLSKSLPKYAQPLIIRLSSSIDITGTFKLKKIEYVKVGYNINLTEDKIYFLQGDKYVQINESLYQDILNEKIRF